MCNVQYFHICVWAVKIEGELKMHIAHGTVEILYIHIAHTQVNIAERIEKNI